MLQPHVFIPNDRSCSLNGKQAVYFLSTQVSTSYLLIPFSTSIKVVDSLTDISLIERSRVNNVNTAIN